MFTDGQLELQQHHHGWLRAAVMLGDYTSLGASANRSIYESNFDHNLHLSCDSLSPIGEIRQRFLKCVSRWAPSQAYQLSCRSLPQRGSTTDLGTIQFRLIIEPFYVDRACIDMLFLNYALLFSSVSFCATLYKFTPYPPAIDLFLSLRSTSALFIF